MLVKDVAFKPDELSNHDYLRTPEIVEDISICFQKKYKVDLLERFSEKTRPCIVKFIDDKTVDDYIQTAIYYLYTVYHNEELSMYCNTCFDGNGKTIIKDNILKVEFLV